LISVVFEERVVVLPTLEGAGGSFSPGLLRSPVKIELDGFFLVEGASLGLSPKVLAGVFILLTKSSLSFAPPFSRLPGSS